jgi:menaquinone-dependent protoporphyrinogen oxidase
MRRSVLVAYATKHGSTQEVAEWVAEALRSQGLAVELADVTEVDDLEAYTGVVLGGALYMGRLHGAARTFLRRHREALARLDVAVFAMGPGTLEPGDVARSRRALDAALGKTPEVAPFAVAIFGGVVAPEKLRFPLNRMPAVDARDQAEIERWAAAVGAGFRYGKPAVEAGDRRRELQQTPR